MDNDDDGVQVSDEALAYLGDSLKDLGILLLKAAKVEAALDSQGVQVEHIDSVMRHVLIRFNPEVREAFQNLEILPERTNGIDQ